MLGLLLLVSWPGTIQAQVGSSDWLPPFKVSDRSGSVGAAYVTGDANGKVYVLWAANSTGLTSARENSQPTDTVYLRVYDGSHWLDSVDVLAVSPSDGNFGMGPFFLDAYGQLVLAWQRGSELNVSTALPAQALRASSWHSAVVSRGENLFGMDLKSSRDGALHLIVAGPAQTMTYYRSRNAGQTWQALSRISAGGDPTLQYAEPRLLTAGDGVLHATWTEHAKQFNWTGSGIFYARSTDGGVSWSNPISLVNTEGNAWSNLSTDGKGNLWLFWDRSVGSKDGRYYARSRDNGLTWTRPILAYDTINISGMSGEAAMWWDSAGQLHLFNAGQGPKGSEIWETQWQGERWAAPAAMTVLGRPTGSEAFSSALAGGNRLLLTWTDFDSKEVYFTSKTYAAPATNDSFLDLPTPAPVAARTPTPSVALALPTRVASQVDGGSGAADMNASPLASPLVAGLVPVACLLLIVILTRLRDRP